MRSSEAGFTIIELIIATAIFAVILIITTTTLIGISQTYIKGSVQGDSQQTARAILTDISQDIQLNGIPNLDGEATTSTSKDYFDFCIGNDVYAFVIDKYLSSTVSSESNNWVLVRYTSSSCPTDASLSTLSLATLEAAGDEPEELLINNERLGQLYISGPNVVKGQDTYTIYIEVAYANDNTLLSGNKIYDSGGYVYENWNTVPPPATNALSYQYPYACESGLDSSFCSVSTLTTTIAPRIQ